MGLTHPFLDPVSTTKPGPKNLITDVPGVTVGQVTYQDGTHNTGVTVIKPTPDNVFQNKVPAAAHVINGFGKSTGLVQVQELGTLETPIVLTNTFAVGTAETALVKALMADNPDIGVTTGTVNPVIMECNDGDINAIRDIFVTEADVTQALATTSTSFEEGTVGAGVGMSCYDLKGGIGSASRVINIDGKPFTMGALVLSNYGFLRDLNIYNEPVGAKLAALQDAEKAKENGSIITIIATDIPFNSRQLTRISKRASVGITRTGAFIGNGSGEIVLAFSTANRISHYPKTELTTQAAISDDKFDRYFRMTVSVVEEAILSVLTHATTVTDRKGQPRQSLRDAIDHYLTVTPDAALERLKQQLGI
ncbi:DmpA family aminopeptidase [Secundilactobacillus paracollinoides]|uniref:Aminopeptidase n=1 Tax=Secundilactobacillus paracollinoides TaxID=240427 RepID=A0A1B2IY89_9LACO|nr:P1 family peptidase [Secundilactobacillus paracollinoides]ANZ61066.1 aminopeptidase [Secundilactobacillus paracollinoides]ANZ66989.1 aminopeptidase [Secundilactobacillus paracollinoides]